MYVTLRSSTCQSVLNLHTVRLFTEGDDTRGCGDTIGPPEDEQRASHPQEDQLYHHSLWYRHPL